MKRLIIYSMALLGLFIFQSVASSKEVTPDEMVKNIHWLGQAAVKIMAGEKVIFIDPYQISEKDKADIILISHSHRDHFSTNDISKIHKENTMFIAPKDCKKTIGDLFKTDVTVLEPGMSTKVGDVLIEAVPAYNTIKTHYHPKKNRWVGYILTIDGVRIYHAGDTERIPEMKNFTCDIAMLPLGQTYTMNSVEEATEAAMDVKAKIAIPIHYGMYEGTAEDAEKFKKILRDKVKVIIKEKE